VYCATRRHLKRMIAIDRGLCARKWPTDKTFSSNLGVDPDRTRRDLGFLCKQFHPLCVPPHFLESFYLLAVSPACIWVAVSLAIIRPVFYNCHLR
jgi:hypothetical protein